MKIPLPTTAANPTPLGNAIRVDIADEEVGWASPTETET
jgi:hypothetical protein